MYSVNVSINISTVSNVSVLPGNKKKCFRKKIAPNYIK